MSDISPSPARHRFSLVTPAQGMADGRLICFDFMGDPLEVDRAWGRLQASLRGKMRDVQIYAPIFGTGSASAEGLLDDVCHAVGFGRWATPSARALDHARAVARQIDEAAGKVQEPEPRDVEFVWANGGSDDNAFTQSFGAANGDLDEHFRLALQELLGDHAYQFTVGVASEDVLPSLQEALAAMASALDRLGFAGEAVIVGEALTPDAPAMRM